MFYLGGYVNNHPNVMDYATTGIYSLYGFYWGLLSSIIRSFLFSFPMTELIGLIVLRKICLFPKKWLIDNKSRVLLLFKDEETYEIEVKKLLMIVYDPKKVKRQDILTLSFGFLLFIMNIFQLYDGSTVFGTDILFTESWIYIIAWIGTGIGNILWGSLFLYIILAVFNLFKLLILFSKNEEINFTGKNKIKESRASFQQYHSIVRIFGDLLFKINFAIVVGGVLISLGFWWSAKSLNSEYSLFINLSQTLIIFASVLLFIVIQLGIHNNLKRAKNNLILDFETILNQKRVILQNQVLFKNNFRKSENIQDLHSSIQFLDWEINQISQMSNWTYNFPKILSLIGGSVISFIPSIINSDLILPI